MTGPAELKSVAFRREREAAWVELEVLVDQVSKRGPRSLTAEDATRLPMLYRGALSALSVARAISLDRNVTDYLESLCGRAYFAVYRTRRPLLSSLWGFFAVWWPGAMREIRWPLLLAASFMVAGGLAGFFLTLDDMDRYYAFVPDGMSGGRNPAATTEFLRNGLYEQSDMSDRLARFASFLFSHNARIGMMAFAVGFAAGLPVLYLLFYNGLILGAFAALYHARGLSLDLWGWLLPHGVTELGAVVVCGAAGLVLARALMFPGRLSRLDNLARRGRVAAGIVAGAVGMFFLAALIEGIFRQTVTDVGVRYGLAGLTLVAWTAYIAFGGRRAS